MASGIELTTFRLVTYCQNQLRTMFLPSVHLLIMKVIKSSPQFRPVLTVMQVCLNRCSLHWMTVMRHNKVKLLPSSQLRWIMGNEHCVITPKSSINVLNPNLNPFWMGYLCFMSDFMTVCATNTAEKHIMHSHAWTKMKQNIPTNRKEKHGHWTWPVVTLRPNKWPGPVCVTY
jgi:hypothetical protein